MKTTLALILLLISLVDASTALADAFGGGANQFTVEFVAVGDPNNPDDVTGEPNPAGKVEYAFRMGKYEISEDMIAKANAQSAADGDPLNISYFGFNAGVNKPATEITWNEAARFVNWLNTSTGHAPAYKFTGGAFDVWQSGDAGYDPANPFRSSQAYYFLPSIDEWYKAAFYDPAAGAYYDYPTGSDSAPDGIDLAGDAVFDAVFEDGGMNSTPNDVMDVGVASPYGTAGQGGNVFEWEETDYFLDNNFNSGVHGVRGGAWHVNSSALVSTFRFNIGIPESNNVGFRVASIPVPEPAAAPLALAALLSWASRRSRSKRAGAQPACQAGDVQIATRRRSFKRQAEVDDGSEVRRPISGFHKKRQKPRRFPSRRRRDRANLAEATSTAASWTNCLGAAEDATNDD